MDEAPKYKRASPNEPGGETRWCSACEKHLPVTSFYKNKSKPDGTTTYCIMHERARTIVKKKVDAAVWDPYPTLDREQVAHIKAKVQELGLKLTAERDNDIAKLVALGVPVTGWEQSFDWDGYTDRALLKIIENPYNQRCQLMAIDLVKKTKCAGANAPYTAIQVNMDKGSVNVAGKTSGTPGHDRDRDGAQEDSRSDLECQALGREDAGAGPRAPGPDGDDNEDGEGSGPQT